MFRAIWESRQSSDCTGILRILRLPGPSANAVQNWIAYNSMRVGNYFRCSAFFLYAWYVTIFIKFWTLSSCGMEHKEHRKVISQFSPYVLIWSQRKSRANYTWNTIHMAQDLEFLGRLIIPSFSGFRDWPEHIYYIKLCYGLFGKVYSQTPK